MAIRGQKRSSVSQVLPLAKRECRSGYKRPHKKEQFCFVSRSSYSFIMFYISALLGFTTHY